MEKENEAMAKKGVFVAIDGPNGAGKTTITKIVCDRLQEQGYAVLQTKEPTPRFDRANEEEYGEVLARLIVKDRRNHLLLDVEPALRSGMIVISDRYVASSLVYRMLDGISFEETWQHNRLFRIPDLNVFLIAEIETLAKRVASRAAKTRFEREHCPEAELLLYHLAEKFLQSVGYTIVTLQNTGIATDIADDIVQQILISRT